MSFDDAVLLPTEHFRAVPQRDDPARGATRRRATGSGRLVAVSDYAPPITGAPAPPAPPAPRARPPARSARPRRPAGRRRQRVAPQAGAPAQPAAAPRHLVARV